MSKFLSMEALRSVSSWCVPTSTSILRASSGLRGGSEDSGSVAVLVVKPRL